MKYIVSLMAILVFAALSRGVYVAFIPLGTVADEVVLEVQPGAPFISVARELADKKLIASSLEFRIMAKLSGLQRDVKIGEYALNGGMNALEILRTITSGKVLQHPITFPEGMNIYEMAEKVEATGYFKKQEFLKVVTDPKLVKEWTGESRATLEGYLYPETYQVSKYSTPHELVKSMVNRFFEIYKKEVEPIVKSKMSRHEIVTLASIVEKETGAPEERSRISSVFHNRMRKGMKLQTDPTVIYGILDQTKVMKKNITKDDLLTPNRYNTYAINGLPFGPISNPGLPALLAAVQPDETPYLFFVSKNDGTHVFSESLEQHNKGVQKFQLDRKAREGKSWRDLKKNKAAN